MTVIELGDLSSGRLDPPAPPIRVDRRRLRPIAVALVAVLCVLGVTGSARSTGPGALRLLWSIPHHQDDLLTLTATSVYTLSFGGDPVLTAHDLGDGSTRWSRAMPRPLSMLELTEAAGVLLVPAERLGKGDGGTYYNEFTTETVALDPRTGAELWRHAGAVSLTGTDTVLFTEQDKSGRLLTRLSLVRLRDGGTVWTRPAPGVEFLANDGTGSGPPRRIITSTSAGQVEVLRFADGVRVAAKSVAWANNEVGDFGFNSLLAAGGRFYISQLNGVQTMVTGYDIDTLRELWRHEDLSPGVIQICGTTLCNYGAEVVTAYDGATGAVRWRVSGAKGLWPIDSRRLMSTPRAEDEPQLLLDAGTGRRIADLGRGVPVVDRHGDPYLLRPTHTPPGRVSISRIDLGTGALTLRGTIDRVLDYGCAALDGRLACPTEDGRLTVTAVG